MSYKGQTNTTTYLEWEKAIYLVHKLKKAEKHKIALLAGIGFYTGLRIGDILKLRWKDILQTEALTITEQKTGKRRTITFHKDLKQLIEECSKVMKYVKPDNLVFLNYKQTKAISIQYANDQLKQTVASLNDKIGNVSSHFLRKTFGRRVWDKNNKSDESLIKLSEVFNHSSIAITKRYLGICQEEIADVYLQL